MRFFFLESYRNLSTASKAAAWFVICSLLQKAAAFVTVPIFTRLMTTEQYGQYSIYLAWTGIMTVLLTLNMENGAFINEYAKTDDTNQKLIAPVSVLSLSTFLVCAATILYLFLYDFIETHIGLPRMLIVLMLIEIFSTPAYRLWTVLQRFLYRYKKLVFVTLSFTFTQIIGGIILVYYSESNYQAIGRVTSIVFPQFCVGLVLIIFFQRKANRLFSTLHWKKIIMLQLPLVAYNLSMVALLSSDKIMINMLVGASAAGIYSIAYAIGQLISILKSSVIDAYHPWIYEKLNSGEYDDLARIIRPLIFLFSLVAIVVSLLAKDIVHILAPASYHDAVSIVPAVAVSVVFTLLNQIFVIIDTYFEKTRNTMYSSVFAALLNILLNYLMIPVWGYKIAGVTTLFSYLALAYANYFFLLRIPEFKSPFKEVDIILLPIIVSLLVSSLSMLYAYTVVLRILFIGILVLGFWFRDPLIKALKIK